MQQFSTTPVQVLSGIVVTSVFHPIGYAKTLIQLGHEPIAPKPTTTFFGKEALAYPNVFKYIKYIKSVDGFFGMYRGLVPRIYGGVLSTFATNYVNEKLEDLFSEEENEVKAELDGDDEDTIIKSLRKFVKDTSKETVARVAGIIVNQPFQVIMVRSMAQFIGRETQYNSVFSSFQDIYEKEGILGFFAGIIPRLAAEVLTIWLANFTTYIINNYTIEDKNLMPYTSIASGLLVTHFTYPFQLVANVMSVNNSGLAAGTPPHMPNYTSWQDCWAHLSRMGELKRGSSLFMRYYRGPVIIRQDGQRVPAKDIFSH
ncbi:mitochondrial carrier homolog 2-like [Tubulanus polymorphus]|uniref:mitochondrial carrier homolog 2-like n=1 Tax=Tubulanus polymorphus TaxID=672921 RepID=UPI003DA38B54